MKILALDQAVVTTGFAVFENNQLITKGTFKTKSTLPIEERLGNIWKSVNELRQEHEIDHIAFEDIQNQGNAETYKKLAYCQAAIYLYCYFNEIPCSVLGPSHWRSLLGIKGRKREEQKKAAIEYVKDKYKIECTSDEADAVCIGAAYLVECSRTTSAF